MQMTSVRGPATAAIASMMLVAGAPTVWAASLLPVKFNPLDANTAGLVAAIAIPESYAVQNGDVVVSIVFRPSDGSAPIAGQFPLDIARAGTSAGITPRSGEAVFVGRLPAVEVKRFQATQRKIKTRRAHVTGKGSFSVTVEGACTTAVTGSLPPMPVRTFIAAPGEGFRQISDSGDFFSLLGLRQAADLRGRIRRCG
ncbi:MAG: hypothetical protein AAFZ05_05290 [Pseudomonadota bacterium]